MKESFCIVILFLPGAGARLAPGKMPSSSSVTHKALGGIVKGDSFKMY